MKEFEIGKRFGYWEVIGPGDKPYYTKCRCKCGKIKDVYNSTLRLNKAMSCGCYQIGKPHPHTEKYFESVKKKYINKEINGLKILDVKVDEKYPHEYDFVCQCSCGKIFTTLKHHVLSGNTKTCGHNRSKQLAAGHEYAKSESIDGTRISSLQTRLNGKTNKNSSTGYNGVSKARHGKYRAYIYFQHKQIHIGTFDTAEEAYEARKIAEEKIYKKFLEGQNEQNI